MTRAPLTPNALAAKAIDEALLVIAKIDQLQALLATYSHALRKEAQQTGTMKDSGLRARSQAEYDLLGVIEDVFNIDTDDAREEIADECLSETGYDPRKASFPAEDAAEFAEYVYNFARDGQLVRAYEDSVTYGMAVS